MTSTAARKMFNFHKEMIDYCLQDVRILLSAIQVREDFDLMGFDRMLHDCLENHDVLSTWLFKRKHNRCH